MAMKVQSGRFVGIDAGSGSGIMSDGERTAVTQAKQIIMSSRDDIQKAMTLAQNSRSTRRPPLYQRALALINQANEVLDQARSSNGR
jgi:hypothetical protein